MEKIKSIEEALSIFEIATNQHAVSDENGDYKTGNKSYKVIMNVLNYLKKENRKQELKIFLHHPNVGVRLWAASILLNEFENEAVEVLKEIMKLDNIHSLTAETTLDEWRKGQLNL